MKHKHVIASLLFAAMPLLVAVPASLASAKETTKSDGKVIGHVSLPNSTVTDLFLRANGASRAILYIAYSNRTISLIDVADPTKPKTVDELRLNQGSSQVKLRPIGPNAVVATEAPDPSQQLSVISGNTTTPAIAKQFSMVGAYTVDSNRNLVFVVDKGELSIFRFDHPVSKDAEIFEQENKAR